MHVVHVILARLLRGRLSRAIRTSPLTVIQRLIGTARQAITDLSARKADVRSATYGNSIPGSLNALLDGIARPGPAEQMSRAVDMFCEHRFDLLGSGWVNVRHGMQCGGLEGIVFPPGPAAVDFGVNSSNRADSSAIRALLPAAYTMIDWQVDFRSGYRWDQRTWHRDIEFGSVRGADVKLPWELSRLQHLPQLAIEFGRTTDNRYASEIRNQLLDWIASNPPRYGVNWYSTMDVAIRAANMLVAYDLARSYGAMFDDAFAIIFRKSIREHAVHIVENLEWSDTLRANHYLANIAGLAFCAAYLPSSGETDSWLEFAAGELENAVREQFHGDGSNFEASSCYHRLSAEMVVYALAILQGASHRLPPSWKFPSFLVERIGGMRRFTQGITKPNGNVWQVGDNDSGRFLKLAPAYGGGSDGPRENFLDHSHVESAVGALFGESSSHHFDALIVRTLLQTSFVAHPPTGDARSSASGPTRAGNPTDQRAVVIAISESSSTPAAEAFPDFGLFVYRNGDLFVGVRCGPVGQNGIGGHAHNDQLSVEVHDMGRDLIADPGTYLYTPLPERRNEYRSAAAHFAPRALGEEQADLTAGLFRLANPWTARCVEFLPERLVGEISNGSRTIRRTVTFAPGQVVVTDEAWGCMLEGNSAASRPPFSPGYGTISRVDS